MNDFKLNFGFLKNFQHIFAENKETTTPKVQALFYLMAITGIYRIFEKEDVFELVKRLQLILPEQKLIDQFLLNEVVLTFEYENEVHEMNVAFLKEFIGFEIIDMNSHQESFESWAVNIPNFKFIANVAADASNFLQLDVSDSNISRKGNTTTIDLGKTPDNDVAFDHQDVKNAELLANEVVKEIPQEKFDRLKKDFPNKFLELEMRNLPFKEPVFDFNSFPVEKQEALWKTFFPNMEHYDDEPTRDYHIKLFHLAWLWANGFVIEKDPFNVYVDPRIKNFDHNGYEIDRSGFNLWETKEDEGLEELFPMLYDPAVALLAERPWENLNIYS
ncbi:hypothetical protein [Christiangramia sabulilitoris]|uniref:Uncharacterized protein n=1 Tax=Christiangramia sabulilitoris TaxID=2583991 RepID=A0A550I7K4_9FLAO|nr:hypothetical protein [Christiangramia sabulilitoris]TRO66947.1 hypothetical protein FGM01_03390 [Christiangramia sabulilitoris]